MGSQGSLVRSIHQAWQRECLCDIDVSIELSPLVVDMVNIPSHTHPATNGTNQYARPNILAARNELVCETRKVVWAPFVYAPGEGIKRACVPWQ